MCDHDILIAGGGPVGSALALALADGRRRIGVIEARAGRPPEGTRAIVLASGSVRLLSALDVWASLAPAAVPVREVDVSQRGRFGRTRITADEEGVDALGRVVRYGTLARALVSRARTAPGVEWIAPAEVTGAEPDGDTVRVDLLTEGRRAARSARVAVAADGTNSPLRSALGVGVREHDYAQVALVVDLATGGPADVAHERFTETGTLALLPRGGTSRTLVWTLSADRARDWMEAPVVELERALAELLGAELGPVRVTGQPEQYPLKRVEAERLVARRGVIVGNAARTLHPVAAQGFNLALRDAGMLAERLLEAEDPGACAVLAEWERSRRPDQRLTRDFTDVLARAFGHGPRVLAAPRAGLLLGIDLCPVVRGMLAAQTMGLARGLPRVGRWRIRDPA